MTPNSLTESRAKDRATMAARVVSLAVECGAQATIRPATLEPRAIRVEIKAARDLNVAVEFRGRRIHAQPDTYVLCWNTYPGPARLRPEFGAVNPYHFAKATHVMYSFDALCAELRRGLTAAADGSAFQPEALT